MTTNLNDTDMDFPAHSQATTDKLFTWEEVRALLDKESMRRSEYIARILEALRAKFGDEVLEIAGRVIYTIGYEKGANRARLVKEQGQENDLRSLAGLISHQTAQLYLGNKVEVAEDQMVVSEDYCPHPKKWKEMGLPMEKVVGYCMLFDQVDKGMIEGYNPDFEAELTGCWNLGKSGVCQMFVRKKPASKEG